MSYDYFSILATDALTDGHFNYVFEYTHKNKPLFYSKQEKRKKKCLPYFYTESFYIKIYYTEKKVKSNAIEHKNNQSFCHVIQSFKKLENMSSIKILKPILLNKDIFSTLN